MENLLNNIESAIHSQVIETGEFEPGMNYYEEFELEYEGNVYFADFYINAKTGDEGEDNVYEIDVIYIAINGEDSNKILFSKNETYQMLADILNPNK
jgi:hypothetical protein